jgi:hypothetical protein
MIEYERILKDVTDPCNKFVSLVKTNQYDLEPVGFDHIVEGSEVSWGYTSNRKARYHHGPTFSTSCPNTIATMHNHGS